MDKRQLQLAARRGEGYFIPTAYHINLGRMSQRIRFAPFSDVHRNAPGCDTSGWKDYIKEEKAQYKNTWWLGVGDYNEFASYTDRKKMQKSDFHDTAKVQLDDYVSVDEGRFLREIDFMKGHLIGMGTGNHEWEYLQGPLQGVTSTACMCEELNCDFLGDLAYVRVFVKFKSGEETHFDVVSAHGRKGGGKLLGTSVNQVDDLRGIFPSADIYVMGHDHTVGGWPSSRLEMMYINHTPVLRQKKQFLARTGSFLKVFEPYQPSYLVKWLKKPNALGTLHFDIGFKKKEHLGEIYIEPDIKCWS